MSAKYTFGRISDAQVLRLMDELTRSYKIALGAVSIGDIASFSISKTEEEGLTEDEREPFQAILTDDSYLITTMSWQSSSTSHSVKYYRQKVWGLNANQQETLIYPSSPFIDAIEVKASSANAPFLLAIVDKHVKMAPPIVGGAEAGTAMDQSQAILNRVSAAVATLVEHTSERQKELDQSRSDLTRDAERSVLTIREEADTQVAAIRKDFETKEIALRQREAGLDDRANTHVRREFAKEMASLSDTRLSANLLSKSQGSFWVPIAICLVAIVFISFLIYRELVYIELFSTNIGSVARDKVLSAEQKTILIGNINYQVLYAQLRVAVQSLGVAALVWFSLRMASSRYSLVSGWERDLHRFRLDTERAGFLVEGDLEARKVNQEGLPDVLLESFSRNLFSSSESSHGPTGGDGLGGALNALLGQAAKVRLGPDGVNVEVEGRGIRRARKLIEDE